MITFLIKKKDLQGFYLTLGITFTLSLSDFVIPVV